MAGDHVWVQVTNLGDSAVLLPLALMIVLWLGVASRAAASVWGLLFGVDLLGVATTKLLYMGWGVHPPGVDFIGLSGHSALSMLVWPSVGSLLAEGRAPRLRRLLPLLGALLGLGITISRLTTDAHTPVEAALGGIWGGGLALLWLLRRPALPAARRASGGLLLATLGITLVLSYGQIFPSTQILERIACDLSGRAHPYTRADLIRPATL